VPNERLRDALLRKGLTPDQVARSIDVDPKTVERWITKGRAPYPKHRHAIAAMVRESETYLWPDAVAPERAAEIAESEVVKVYPHRHSVPRELWDQLIDHASQDIEILVYVGMFLTEYPSLIKTLKAKAKAGAKIRLLLGDPKSPEVTRRSEDEGIGEKTIAAKIQHALAFYKPLADLPGVETRLHSTTLYNSIYRFDDDMIVNTHVYGFAAPHAPTLHLRRLSAGDLFETYSESFESVWNAAKSPTW
jgi:transcriptional regulator with XRE-family HTH domain